MKKFNLILSLLFLSVILIACGNNEESNNDVEQSSDTNKQDEDKNQREERQSTEESEVKTDQSLHKDSTSKNDNASKMKNNDNSKSYLNDLSSSKIEYARIWHQLGKVKDVKNIYVKKYPKGTPVNKNAEKSAMYPEDVVKLEAPMK